jgi:hypothetical protein
VPAVIMLPTGKLGAVRMTAGRRPGRMVGLLTEVLVPLVVEQFLRAWAREARAPYLIFPSLYITC